jgi:hypothetical protein
MAQGENIMLKRMKRLVRVHHRLSGERRHRRKCATAGGCRRGRLLNGFGGLNDIERGGPCYIGGVEYGSCVSKNRIGFVKYAKDCIR